MIVYRDQRHAAPCQHHLHESVIQKAVHQAAHRAGLAKRVTTHAFRHSFATHLLANAWSTYGAPTTVEWIFTPRPDGTTFVSVTNAGFSGDMEQVMQQVIGSTEGFALVLAGLKALLEYNVRLNLMGGRFPDGFPGD